MIDPFAAALVAMFRAPGSVEAAYVPAIGSPVVLRVIRSRPDQETGFRGARVVQSTNQFEIRRADAPDLKAGELLIINGEQFKLGEPLLDVEGLTWTCGGDPQP